MSGATHVKTTIDFPGAESYEVIHYPAGESQVRIPKQFVEPLRVSDQVIIRARLGNARDIIELLLLVDAIQGIGQMPIDLHIPYFPYSRADRRFVSGDCYGLGMFRTLLAGCGFREIRTLDVHSNASKLLPNLLDVWPSELITRAISDLRKKYTEQQPVILLPDAGAATRYAIKGMDVEHATKRRNPATGAFEGFDVPNMSQYPWQPILIIDDICDGGGTFIGIAKAIRAQGLSNDLYLCVTHGIFSKGILVLSPWFSDMYTTNSIGMGHSIWADQDSPVKKWVHVYDAFAMLEPPRE